MEKFKTFLANKHIKVPDDWLVQCIEYVQRELNASVKFDDLSSNVYEQWLTEDLAQLECAVFPSCITKANRFVLNGIFAVQMNSIWDSSVSSYSQFLKITEMENENNDVDADEEEQKKTWERDKIKRLLVMELTDGVTTVKAMEYQPVPSLNVNLEPGTKILLSGRIECRKGMLMLCADNVKVLGGNVDALIAENSQKSLLKKRLDALPKDRPNVAINVDNGTQRIIARPPTAPIQRAPANNVLSNYQQRNVDIRTMNGGRSTTRNSPIIKKRESPESPDVKRELLDDSDDDVVLMEACEKVEQETKILSQRKHPARPTYATSNFAPPVKKERKVDSFNEDFRQAAVEDFVQFEPRQSGIQTRSPSPEYFFNDDEVLDFLHHDRNQDEPVRNAIDECFGDIVLANDDLFDTSAEIPQYSGPKEEIEVDDSVKTFHNVVASIASSSGDFEIDIIHHPWLGADLNVRLKNVQHNLVSCAKNLRLTRLIDLVPRSDALNVQSRVCTAKAVIIHTVKRLDMNDGLSWTYRAKFSDGTATIDCDISDEVLTEIIGMTAAEASAIRNSAFDSAKREAGDRVKAAGNFFVRFNGFVQIETRFQSMPVVRKMKPLESAEVKSLEQYYLKNISS